MIKAVGLPRINIDLVYAKKCSSKFIGPVSKPPEPLIHKPQTFQHYDIKSWIHTTIYYQNILAN